MKSTLSLLNNPTALSILAYSLCSGTLVLLNKLVLHTMKLPSLVVCVQLAAALVFIFVAKHMKILQVDALHWPFVVPYLYYIVLFSCGVYCNMKSLTQSNVETVIVFRALTPCIVAWLDVLFLGRVWPSSRSWTGLGLIVAGAYGYASFDEEFQKQGAAAYAWPTAYLFIIALEMAYGKRIIQSVDLKTLSGPVLYTNLLGLPPMLLFAGLGGEYHRFVDTYMIERVAIPGAIWVFLLLGCVAGTGIGYAGWWCRGNVSATTFTLVGVINKCLTIVLNYYIWDQHANFRGICCLGLCLVGGAMYRQAPLRDEVSQKTDADLEKDLLVEASDDASDDVESQPSTSMKRRG